MEATRFAPCMRYVTTCVADSHIAIQHARPHQKLICPVTQMDRVAGPSHQGSRQFGGSELLNSYGSGRGQKSSRRHSTDSVALHELRAALIISRVQSRSAGREQVHHTYIRSQTHAVLSSTPHAATCWGHRLYIHVHHASSLHASKLSLPQSI